MPERKESSPKSTYLHCEKRLFCLRLTDSFGLESHWHKDVNMHERQQLRKGLVSAEKDKIGLVHKKKKKKKQHMIENMSSWLPVFSA